MEKFIKKLRQIDWDKLLGITVLALSTVVSLAALVISLLLEAGLISF